MLMSTLPCCAANSAGRRVARKVGVANERKRGHPRSPIGASAAGVEALSRFAAGLSPKSAYAYLVVLHIPDGAPSILARIIDRAGPLPAESATDDAKLRPGHIYVGVPDRHLLVDDHRVVSSQGPTENAHRPAINALFRSVALEFGPRGVGVLMSGVLDDSSTVAMHSVSS